MIDGHHDVMWGMHWGWWFFSVLFVIALVYLAGVGLKRRGSTPRRHHDAPRQSARETLESRLAEGEISMEEFRKLKDALNGRR